MTKFAAYVARILLCESFEFVEKIFYSNWDNEFFLRDCFLLAHPVYSLLKMAAEKGACQKQKWSKTGRLYATIATDIFGLNGLARRTSYPVDQTAGFLIFLRKLWKNQFSLHENVNNSST